MKLLTLQSGKAFHPGVVVDGFALDLVVAAQALAGSPPPPVDLRTILANPGTFSAWLERCAEPHARAALEASGALIRMEHAHFAPVIPDPAVFLSVGANSRGHIREMGDEPPPEPEGFFKVRSALAASGDEIRPPLKYSEMLDWEGEMCFVVGRRCHRVSPDQATNYIAGYTLTNDVSARDGVREFITASGRPQVVSALRRLTQLKNFPGFCPVGPVIATPDEFPDDFDYHLETLVNGVVVQSSTKADLVFQPAEILSYFSEFYVFEPGDIVSLGCPPGVGMAMKPPRFLKPGDLVEIRCPQIGVLSNRIGPPSGG